MNKHPSETRDNSRAHRPLVPSPHAAGSSSALLPDPIGDRTGNLRGIGGRGFGGGRGQGGDRRGGYRGRGTGQSNSPRGGGRGSSTSTRGTGNNTPRSTHFLALPLNTHPNLRTHISAFQNALIAHDPPINGLDKSIVIDPRRLHMTLGVMALEDGFDDDDESNPGEREESNGGEGNTSLFFPEALGRPGPPPGTSALGSSSAVHASFPSSSSQTTAQVGHGNIHPGSSSFNANPAPTLGSNTPLALPSSSNAPPQPPPLERKTVKTALALLHSLHPHISQLLADSNSGVGVQVPLMHLDVFPPGATTNANVLFLGPPPSANPRGGLERGENNALWRVSNFVHAEFKKRGYITDGRPLKLHCTILNASHRKPRSRLPFSYSNILSATQAITMLDVEDRESQDILDTIEPTKNAQARRSSSHICVNTGTYTVETIELWVMGSHTANNEYVSLGGIRLE